MPDEYVVTVHPQLPIVAEVGVRQGPAGPPGTLIRFGAGAPDNGTGANGDIWWDTTNHRVYERVTGAYVLREALGAGGGSDAHYLHTQGVASAAWVIAHNLGKRPAITVIDSQGDECEGDITHDSANQVTVRFSAPFSGVAFCN